MLRRILEECRDSMGEVVIMVANSAASAEVLANLAELRIEDDVASVGPERETHTHLYLSHVRQVKFIFKVSGKRQPSYSVWFLDEQGDPVFRVYLRETADQAHNRRRREKFMRLKQIYKDTVTLETPNGEAAP